MPAVSKKQAAFMRSVIAGKAKAPGLSKAEARKFVDHVPTKNLPTRANRSKR